jgi:hypothetical protein
VMLLLRLLPQDSEGSSEHQTWSGLWRAEHVTSEGLLSGKCLAPETWKPFES